MKNYLILFSLTLHFSSVLLGLETKLFSSETPSPACLSASVTGEVYIGIDKKGSLGKGPNAGQILKLQDTNLDGIADKQTIFATVDHPRGLISIGNKLYVLHSIYNGNTLTSIQLSILEDTDGDGVADAAPKPLIKNLSTLKHNIDRGIDHSTNGIAMGIDGWIYIAIGDFGFTEAEDSTGKKLTLLGGGILRVQPDGTNMEMYTTGLRNIYDMAIDGAMNIYTRGNTNDGDGWNIRFIHHLQNADYGYPSKFKHYTHEILPALADLSGGSGTGALFLDEPQWPQTVNQKPLMVDWGRKAIFAHHLNKNGASFTQKEHIFLNSPQPTDIDVDGSGRMYISNWDGAGYKGSDTKGHTIQVIPENWEYQEITSFSSLNFEQLLEHLIGPSAKLRLEAQQEILSRARTTQFSTSQIQFIFEQVSNTKLSLYSRLAALYAYAQLAVLNKDLAKQAVQSLTSLSTDTSLTATILKVLSEHKQLAQHTSLELYTQATQSADDTIKIAAYNGLSKVSQNNDQKAQAAQAILDSQNNPLPIQSLVKDNSKTIKVKANQQKTINYKILRGKQININISSKVDDNEVTLSKLGSISRHDEKTLLDKIDITKNKKTTKGVPFNSEKNFVIKGDASILLKNRTAAHFHFDIKSNADVTLEIQPEKGFYIGEHAKPNANIITPHLAVKNLIKLHAWQSCLDALNTPAQDVALQALASMFEVKTIQPLINQFKESPDPIFKEKVLYTLGRLYQQEAPYDGSWWWKTRPDTRGPFYKGTTWAGSSVIEQFYLNLLHKENNSAWTKKIILYNHAFRMKLANIPNFTNEKEEVYAGLDFSKVMSKQGAIASMSIEDIILSLDKVQGNIKLGEKVFNQQGCIVCHTNSSDQSLKGPNMAQIGGILNRAEIAESIIMPNASISQGFATSIITTKNGQEHIGFIIKQTSDATTIMNIAGLVTTIKDSDIKKITKNESVSQMPAGLANALNLKEFVSLVDYLSSLK